jgi:phosphotransferase system enzyme I (PtsI)
MKSGIAASRGYAIGRAYVIRMEEIVMEDKSVTDKEEEKKKLKEAIDASRKQLTDLMDKTIREIGESEAQVFACQRMMLEDPEFIGTAVKTLENGDLSAQKAVKTVVDMYMSIFSGIDDEYMKERAADIKDVGNRVLRNLAGNITEELSEIEDNTIVIAHDLTPSDTAQLDRKKVIAFLTDKGGPTSHSAIMARTLEIPAVVGMEDITSAVKTDDMLIVDGIDGIVIINPDEETLKAYEIKSLQLQAERQQLKKLINAETITKQGKKVIVAGNIASPEDVDSVIKNGGAGIGLFRTEFLYMDRNKLPSEEVQFKAYKAVAEKLKDKPVTIRTLDIGGDKKLHYLPMPEEMNPFLGYRAIRLCFGRTDIFKTQLRAILRASTYGRVQIMFPMISSLEELFKAKEILRECMSELKSESIDYNENIEIGIMVEIPSAAVMADEFAKHVDFFSIGTNDLIQYTLAVDRMNENISHLYNPMHPAVLRLIKMTIDAAHKEGKWCGMCGEMAGDETAIPILLEYGLDEFSMSASSILKAKQIIIGSA